MVNLEQVSNAMVTEYRFQLDVEWASFIVRQYAGKEEYEVEWLVGPIPGSMSVICFGRGRVKYSKIYLSPFQWMITRVKRSFSDTTPKPS